MDDEGGAVFWGDGPKGVCGSFVKRVDGSRGELPHVRFDPGEAVLYRGQVWAVGRQIEQACAARLDGLASTGNLVRCEIVHDDNAVLGERRREQLFTPGHERISIHGTVEQHGRDKAVGRQSIEEGDGLPVSVRDRRSATLSLLRPSSHARHLGGDATFVDEDQVPEVKLRSPSRLPLNAVED